MDKQNKIIAFAIYPNPASNVINFSVRTNVQLIKRQDHNLGSEILGISAGNFRIRLIRARQNLYNWMNKRCGLINKSNPCRCAKKTRAYIEAGVVDPNNLVFNTRHKKKIYELSQQNAVTINHTVEALYKNVFQQHPLQEPLTSTKIVDEIFNNNLIKLILDL